jgi:hypothetical protein
VLNENAKEVFYNDVPDDIRDPMMKETTGVLQSFGAFMSPVGFVPSDLAIQATYLVCENDKCVPPSLQEGQLVSALNIRVEKCSAGHSPMLSQPERTVDVIVKVARG